MRKFLAGISKSILYFFGGVFFTLFIFTVIIVIVLYNENARLRNEINKFKYKSEQIELPPAVKKIIPNEIIEEEPEEAKPVAVTRGISWHNWQNLKRNMTAEEVVNLIGNPTQIVSMIDTTKYIYKDGANEGSVSFNRQMRVITWNRL